MSAFLQVIRPGSFSYSPGALDKTMQTAAEWRRSMPRCPHFYRSSGQGRFHIVQAP